MKICFKCNQRKVNSEFYRHSQMADGRLGKCKECCKSYEKKFRRDNPEKKREYESVRNKDPLRRKKKLEYAKNRKLRNPLKARANELVAIHINSGRLVRPEKYSACWKKCTPEAHHEDYTKPLEIIWLCFKCHRARHGQIAQDVLNR